MLAPLNDGARIFEHKGDLAIQLEVPSGSSLSQDDIVKLLRIASWESGKADWGIAGFEGSRGVVVSKSDLCGNLRGLLVSGIGYNPPIQKIGDTYEQGDHMSPPSTDNFMKIVSGDKMRTSIVVDGRIIIKRPSYAPLGAYCQRGMVRKIENTILASRLRVSNLGRPTVEAWGRYVDLVYGGQNLGFLVFGIPSANVLRFAAEYMQKAIANKYSFTKFSQDMAQVMELMGKALKGLHKAGYAHHQPHFSNFYLVNGQIFLMDWSTMMPLGKVKDERAKNQAIDLRIAQQNTMILGSALYNIDKEDLWEFSMLMLTNIMSAYFGRKIDMAANLLAMLGAGMGDLTEMEAIVEVIKGNGKVKV